MTPEQRDMIMDLRDPPTAEDNDWEMLDNILAGDATLQISHEGGEFDALNEFRERMSKTYVFFPLTHTSKLIHLYLQSESSYRLPHSLQSD